MRRLATACLVLVWLATSARAAEPSPPQRPVLFEKDIRPLLKAHCFHCHGEAGEREGNLDVRLQRLLLQGGDSGPAIVPGKSEESYLLQRIASQEMPPGDLKLTAEEVDLFRRWIAAGAKTARPEPEQLDGPLITEEERTFWSFQPVRRPPVPEVRNADLVRNPIDAFLLQKLEAAGLGFSSEADKRTLIRRVTFDLIGLPPTPEEVAEFLADDSPDAWQRLVDRLLESPHYGERWGRHWLDVAGYADSEGYTQTDAVREWAWKYRDYVIRAFNEDLPFDQFITEQLAGDELVSPPYAEASPEDLQKLIATGFLRMAPDGTGDSGIEQDVARNQTIADTIQIVSTSLLGLTVACAQCHDHRYDPIPQTDYFHFRAIFEPAFNWKQWKTPAARRVTILSAADRKRADEIEAQAVLIDQERKQREEVLIEETFAAELAKVPEELREEVRAARETPAGNRTPEQKTLLQKFPSVNVSAGSLRLYNREAAAELAAIAERAAKIRATKPRPQYIRALTETPGQAPETFLFYRGDHQQPRQALAPASLTVLYPEPSQRRIPPNDESLPTTGRRLALARQLTDRAHPLTARVFVNRVWLHHFGRAIVATPGDFGMLGDRPTHPELLDWLASEFMESGWRVKRLHRLILNSTAYRQQLRQDPQHEEIDPDNRLFGGTRLRRLEAEIIRDAVLAVSGMLNPKREGPPVPVMADSVGQFVIGIENLNAGRPGPVIPMNGEEFRRSVYVQVRRSRPLAVMDAFDAPRMDPNCEIRASSTVTPQSLMLLNSEFIVAQSEYFANRVAREAGDQPPAQIERAWRLAFGRAPDQQETQVALEFLRQQAELFQKPSTDNKDDAGDSSEYKTGQLPPDRQALASLCQMLLSANEFLYID